MPKKRSSLRWSGNGKYIYAKKVKHPGYKGDDFMYRSARNIIDNLTKIAKDKLNEL
jgi:Holliday junction resolvase RusA-like endonuclease